MDYYINFLILHKDIYLICVGVLSVFIGSFLNVVIYRFPRIIINSWQKECSDFFSVDLKQPYKDLNLCLPRSRCTSCNRLITWWQNIPVASFIFLRGKCYNCKHKISWRYPFVEILCCVISIVVAHKFGVTIKAAYLLVLSWFLIPITFIDLEHHLIPDELIYIPLWIGLFASCSNIFHPASAAIIGAIVGYMLFWSIYFIYKVFTGREGMGHGDFKLLAMLGAWVGWYNQLTVVLISSILGTIVGFTWIKLTNNSASKPIPFGPFLAIAGWITALFGSDINHWYLSNRILF